jgi:peptidoglycan/LPS O-acetylase OafA/YrhL
MKHPISRSQAFDAFKANPYFEVLDGLRAVSILAVLFHHVTKYPREHVLHTLQDNGRYGVAFFFVISGFLICTLFLREQEKTGKIDLGQFYARRALRLLPLYYLALLAQALLVFALNQYSPENRELFREKLTSYLFYYSNWLPTATQGPFFCAWSLAVEEQFYLVFGLLLFAASRRVVIGAAATALFVKVFVFWWWGNVDIGSTVWRVVFSYQEPILLGVLVAFVLNSRSGYELAARLMPRAWVLAALMAALPVWLFFHPMRGQSSPDAELLYLLMTMIVIGSVVRPKVPLLGTRLMTHLGRISYGIYLLHMFVISLAKKAGASAPIPCFIVSAVAVIAIASLVYRYFEYPIIHFYKQKLSPLNQTPVNDRQDMAPRVLASSPAVLPSSPRLLPPSASNM